MWFEPLEATEARAAADGGDFVAAARRVLSSKQIRHRVCQKLLAELAPQLIELAEETLKAGDADAALDQLNLAAQCGADPTRLQPLRCEAELLRNKEQADRNWRDRRVNDARHMADQGRLVSAVEWIEPVADDPVPAGDHRDWQDRLLKLDRLVIQIREHLDRGQLDAARERWSQAAGIYRLDPQVVELGQELNQQRRTRQQQQQTTGSQQAAGDQAKLVDGKPADGPPNPVTPAACQAGETAASRVTLPLPLPLPLAIDSGGNSAFTFSDGQSRVLVLTKGEVVFGAASGPATDDSGIDVPLRSRLHGRQFLLMRDGRVVRLVPYSSTSVIHNSQPCRSDEPLELNDGDRIELEHGRLKFRVRRPTDSDDGTVVLAVDPTTVVCDAGGQRLDRIILLDRKCNIAPQTSAHWCLPDLPGEGLTLQRDKAEIVAEPRGNIVWWETPATEERPESNTSIIGRLHIDADLPETELLGRQWLGTGSESCVLELQRFPLLHK